MSRARLCLLAGLGVLLVGLLLWWLSSAPAGNLPETINGFSTRAPFRAAPPTDPRTGRPLPPPPAPKHLIQQLRAKGLGPQPPAPDPNHLPPLPDDAPPILPPPPLLRTGPDGLPEKVEVGSPGSSK